MTRTDGTGRGRLKKRRTTRRRNRSANKGSPKLAFRCYGQVPSPQALPANFWDVPDLCRAYNWPSGLSGGGVIALVEFAGGWLQSDLDQYFAAVGQPSPSMVDFSVDGTTNFHGPDPNGYDAEVALGIEVVGASYFAATGQPASIRVYWSQDIAMAVQAAAADGCDVCSISWGADETDWKAPKTCSKMEQAALAATEAGMVVFAASGDNDSKDGGDAAANVDCPASCPHVIGCGGTTKTRASETVWNNNPGETDGRGTGGGFSTQFRPLPAWQIGAPNGPGRMVPDVAANADPNTGYSIIVHGQAATRGGTSGVAPLYAGLFAAFGKRLGYISPKLWLNPLCFTDITVGDNGAFRADRGPDPCTGLGVPDGKKLSTLFT